MMDSILAFPAETEGRGNQPLEPEVLADGTKRFELTASIVDWEVRPGEVVQAWAYNGMVPGPRIDLDVGDKVEVEVTNELPIGTDVHWHGIDVPNDQDGVAPLTQELISSGETLHLPLHGRGTGRQHVPRPRPRSGRRAQRDVRHDLRRRDAAARRADDLGASRSRPTSRSPRTSRWCSTTPA